jgi:hypothetical protein
MALTLDVRPQFKPSFFQTMDLPMIGFVFDADQFARPYSCGRRGTFTD